MRSFPVAGQEVCCRTFDDDPGLPSDRDGKSGLLACCFRDGVSPGPCALALEPNDRGIGLSKTVCRFHPAETEVGVKGEPESFSTPVRLNVLLRETEYLHRAEMSFLICNTLCAVSCGRESAGYGFVEPCVKKSFVPLTAWIICSIM